MTPLPEKDHDFSRRRITLEDALRAEHSATETGQITAFCTECDDAVICDHADLQGYCKSCGKTVTVLNPLIAFGLL